jgi:CBS-domain-containing membrane protein
MGRGGRLLVRVVARWGTTQCPSVPACLWMTGLLGVLLWFDHVGDGVFLIPPFAATLGILAYLPEVAIAQPLAVVCGSVAGAVIGTGLTMVIGFGPDVAMLAALSATIVLPLLRILHPPGIALAMYPALLHPDAWFAIQVVLPFTLIAVISAAAMSRMLPSFPKYPRQLRVDSG